MHGKLYVNEEPYLCNNLIEILHYFIDKNNRTIPFTYLDYTSGSANDKKTTYQDIDLKARRIAALLQTRGNFGDRILLIYPAGLDYICAFFGCIYAGMIAVPAYPPLNERLHYRLEKIAENCDAKIALSTSDIIASLNMSDKITPSLKEVVWLSTVDSLDGFEHLWLQSDISREDIAFLQYTSGSTGMPKGVKVSHKNLLHNLSAIAASLHFMPNDHHFSWLPPYHDMGFVGALLGSFAASIPVTFMAPASFLRKPARWLQEISKRKCTISGAPNFAYELCVERIHDNEMENIDLSCWQLAYSGAEPVRLKTLEKFSQRFNPFNFNGKSFYPCYGMAETTLLVSGSERTQGAKIYSTDGNMQFNDQLENNESKQLISCGKIAVGFDVKIVDSETLNILPDERIGEILIASDSVSSGYWQDREKNKESFNITADNSNKKYFRTGDLGLLKKGELILCGRKKDIIIINGVNFYPHDIEDIVSNCSPDIRKGCGIAFSIDINDKEHLVFVQEINPNSSVDFDELIRSINQAISSELLINPKYIVLIKNGSLPKTTSGKLSRRPCREKYLENGLDIIKIWESRF